jgi:hypothetical protein
MSHVKPFVPVGTSNEVAGATGDYRPHFVLSTIKQRGSMSSCVSEKPGYRLHAENRARSPFPNEMNVGGLVRAETHIPSGQTTGLAY